MPDSLSESSDTLTPAQRQVLPIVDAAVAQYARRLSGHCSNGAHGGCAYRDCRCECHTRRDRP